MAKVAQVGIKIMDTDAAIIKNIIAAIKDQLFKVCRTIASNVELEVRLLFEDRISKSPVWKSLLSGELMGHMGLFDPDSVLEEIMFYWMQQIHVTAIPFRTQGQGLVGGLDIKLIDFSFKDVTKLPAAIVQSKGGDVYWLKWLLFSGSKVLVKNYRIRFDQYNKPVPSRSGIAIMARSQGSTWRVPLQYAGVAGDNFVTKAFDKFDVEITNIIVKNFQLALV